MPLPSCTSTTHTHGNDTEEREREKESSTNVEVSGEHYRACEVVIEDESIARPIAHDRVSNSH